MGSLARMVSCQSVQSRRCLKRILGLLFLLPSLAVAENQLSDIQRQQVIRAFLAEIPFVHRTIPRGKAGIRIDGDKIFPTDAEISQLITESGPAAKIGERAKITAVRFVHGGIVFEINGGPVKHKKWSDHVSVGVNGAGVPKVGQTQSDDSDSNNSKGSLVVLTLKENTASLTTDQIKDLLAPVLDFTARSTAEAYQKSLPPLLSAAVKNHHALVGMDKEMVTYTLGRPPRRLRETKDGQDYEEWIYGAPPQDVQFIRFLGERTVSIEEMKVTGEKLVRTQDEMADFKGALNASSQSRSRPDSISSSSEEDRHAPTLLRPDEAPTKDKDSTPPPPH